MTIKSELQNTCLKFKLKQILQLILVLLIALCFYSIYQIHKMDQENEHHSILKVITSPLQNANWTQRQEQEEEQQQGLEDKEIDIQKSSSRAIMSFIQDSIRYVPGAVALGQSIIENSGFFGDEVLPEDRPKMIILTFSNFTDEKSIRYLKAVGWEIVQVEPIKPFKDGYASRFRHQFTKLRIWSMTEYSSVLYIDSDCIVKGSLNGVFEMVEAPTGLEFGVVGDVWPNKFDLRFNAGVMLIRPSAESYNDLMTKGPKINYNPEFAEQNMLNIYYEHKYLRLPYIYNLNLVLFSHHPKIWNKLWPDTRIIHFTMCKPFMGKCENYGEATSFWRDVYARGKAKYSELEIEEASEQDVEQSE